MAGGGDKVWAPMWAGEQAMGTSVHFWGSRRGGRDDDDDDDEGIFRLNMPACACTNMHISKHKNWGLFYAHKSELYQVYTWQVSFNKQQLYGFMGITYEQSYYVY